MFDAKSKTTLRRRLLSWFDKNQRDLPWRKRKTPYRIWVSEIMLQQTQVATVIDYYLRFTKQFPNVKKLAAAQETEVLKLWEGLGYYRRARQLHAAAKIVVAEHGGKFPVDFEDVLALPGIGRYTAGAILSISQDQQLPILEGNTIRLFARLMAMKSDPRSTQNQKNLWKFSKSLLPKKRCGDFNQALMELGSLICTPRDPKCEQCPLMNLCPTFLNSLQSEIPVAAEKTKYEDINEAVVLVPRTIKGVQKYLVRLCGSGERWEGLWDFPRFLLEKEDAPSASMRGSGNKKRSESHSTPAQQLQAKLKQQFGLTAEIKPIDHRIKHAVTRYRITLDCFAAMSISGRLKTSKTELAWKTAGELDQLAMSVTGRKIATQIKRGNQLKMFG
jgi:A/G-specific adenine glycosylase